MLRCLPGLILSFLSRTAEGIPQPPSACFLPTFRLLEAIWCVVLDQLFGGWLLVVCYASGSFKRGFEAVLYLDQISQSKIHCVLIKML